jgi:two-component system cell cycle response regulator
VPTAVLVADDDPVTREVLSTLLPKWDFQATAVSDGNEALRLLIQEQGPRLAILDWMMPGLDGLEVIRRVRVSRSQPYTYMLVLTAKDRREDILHGLNAGADDYLVKPFDAEELKARLLIGKRILSLQQRLVSALEIAEFRGTHDALTGVYNRNAVLEFLRREADRSQRENIELALVLLDVDNFKAVNDAYGCLVGDQVLKLLALRMKSVLRYYDCLGRCCGEEFMIVAPHCQLQDGLAIAERIRSSIASDNLLIGDLSIQVTVSSGVVAAQGSDAEPGSLLAAAYAALDFAKSRGANRVESAARATAAGSHG